jgi:hypothetical protein
MSTDKFQPNRPLGLWRAIQTAHRGKTKPLDVKRDGRRVYWNPLTDAGWLEYQRAGWVIDRHPWLEKLLRWSGWI